MLLWEGPGGAGGVHGSGRGRGHGQGGGAGARRGKGESPPSCPPHPIICLYGISRVKINRGVGAGGAEGANIQMGGRAPPIFDIQLFITL